MGRGKGNSFIWKSEAEGSSRKALAGVGEHPLNKRICYSEAGAAHHVSQGFRCTSCHHESFETGWL